MTTAEALALLIQLTGSLAQLTANIQTIGALVQKAQQEGRTTFTADEWAQIQNIDTAARQQLIAAITAALQK